ncbi:MAG TPA: Na+/H+ antiporter NhaC family protein [Candidatus Avanaerovorax faecigallinarum]|nr:Na+/H+ antiporter NhaC family protein [Candidatus Avanaerovorax faecigallinarum]
MKSLKQRAAWIMGMAMLIVASCPVLAMAEEEEYVPPLYDTAWALLPPVVAIGLALITKEVYSSLFIGIVVGGLLYSNFGFEGTFTHVLQDGIIMNLSDSYNVGILVFLVTLGIIVCLMNMTGGSAAFGRWAGTKIKTRTGAQLTTVLLGCLIFVDDYFNCLTVGSVMRPITESHRVSKAKLSYLIDATAAPVCIIAPVSSWAAAVSGFVEGEDGFAVFIRAIPWNYYALLTIFFMIMTTILRIDFGPMRKHEENAIKYNDIYTTPERPFADSENVKVNENGKVIDLVIPVIIIIICCVTGIVYSGGGFSGTPFIESFANSDAAIGLSTGGLFALIIVIIYYMCRRAISFRDAMDQVPNGFQAMIAPILILTFAWTLKTMTDSLGAAPFVAGIIQGSAGALQSLVPAVVFLVGCGLGFATGTSWGTFGVLIPIVIAAFGGNPDQETLMYISISACMGGAVMGDHCSPISDTTIMASAGAQCYHINHVNTQLPYAILVAIVSCVGYVFAGFIQNVVINLIIAFALMTLVLMVIRKMYGAEDRA